MMERIIEESAHRFSLLRSYAYMQGSESISVYLPRLRRVGTGEKFQRISFLVLTYKAAVVVGSRVCRGPVHS